MDWLVGDAVAMSGKIKIKKRNRTDVSIPLRVQGEGLFRGRSWAFHRAEVSKGQTDPARLVTRRIWGQKIKTSEDLGRRRNRRNIGLDCLIE